ncbi:MAG: von Willebrand factor type, partial [Frankiales bacterium]|nr:von Willebrand factor type [Frankiales bacterium]
PDPAGAMSWPDGFLAPSRLWLLLVPVALAAAYVLLQRRRPAYALRFTELDLLASLVPRSAVWKRHVPAALLLLALLALTTAFARPTGDVRVPRERATVVVALDVSISMRAEDVSPDRITAAREAASTFVEGLPDRFNVGLVSFSGVASVVVPPTQDHATVQAAIGSLGLANSTAIGEAVFAGLAALRSVPGEPGQQAPPARIVLLSDGTNTVGRSPSVAAEAALAAGVPVSTIAYGTQEGVVELDGQVIQVPVDEPALQRLARATGGSAFSAQSGEELEAVYDDIGTQVGSTVEQRETTAAVTGVALALALAGAAASLVWSARLP